MITNIKTDKIFPHPDNPRTDLGDLAELAESIKTSGILQNLTVVLQTPGYCRSCNIYNGAWGKCTEDHDENERPPCSKWESKGNYTVVIGHRRLAAAKLAELDEIPCSIADMDLNTQIATMLLENMQRNDLTYSEQANGIQMMLDLGETVGTVSEKTGLSETTVRRRVKLLELDKGKLKAAEARGATLQDYMELDKIEDIGLRNETLDKIGTPNFKNDLKYALEWGKWRKRKAEILKDIEEYAEEAGDVGDYSYVMCVDRYDCDKYERPGDADAVKYYYKVSFNGAAINIYRKKDKKLDEEISKVREKLDKHHQLSAQFGETRDRAFRLRLDFAKGFYPANKEQMKTIKEFALNAMIKSGDCILDVKMFLGILGLDEPEDGGAFPSEAVGAMFADTPERALFAAAYCLADWPSNGYHNWSLQHIKNERLDMVYDFLGRLGYEMSDEERAMQDGTHELFAEESEEKK